MNSRPSRPFFFYYNVNDIDSIACALFETSAFVFSPHFGFLCVSSDCRTGKLFFFVNHICWIIIFELSVHKPANTGTVEIFSQNDFLL